MKKKGAEKLYRPATIEKYQKKITLLGFRRYDVTFFLNVRLLASIFLFFMLLYIVEWGYLIAPIVVVCYYAIFPKVTIDQKLSRRKKQLEEEAFLVFERLLYALQAGKSLLLALDLISRNREGILEREFQRTVAEVNVGKKMTDALHCLIERIPSDSIQSILLFLKEGFTYGSDLVEVLTREMEKLEKREIELRVDRFREKMQRIRMLSVFFFLLIFLILILSPIMIKYFIE